MSISGSTSRGIWWQLVLVEFVQVGGFDAKSYKLNLDFLYKIVQVEVFYAKSYKLNFLRAFWKCVLVEFVLVETVLVGDH